MILSRIEASEFIESKNGKVLSIVRAERDWLASHLKVWVDGSSAKTYVNDIVGQNSEWAGYAQLIAHFSGNHRWRCCDQVEALKLLSTAAHKLELAACERPNLQPSTCNLQHQ